MTRLHRKPVYCSYPPDIQRHNSLLTIITPHSWNPPIPRCTGGTQGYSGVSIFYIRKYNSQPRRTLSSWFIGCLLRQRSPAPLSPPRMPVSSVYGASDSRCSTQAWLCYRTWRGLIRCSAGSLGCVTKRRTLELLGRFLHLVRTFLPSKHQHFGNIPFMQHCQIRDILRSLSLAVS